MPAPFLPTLRTFSQGTGLAGSEEARREEQVAQAINRQEDQIMNKRQQSPQGRPLLDIAQGVAHEKGFENLFDSRPRIDPPDDNNQPGDEAPDKQDPDYHYSLITTITSQVEDVSSSLSKYLSNIELMQEKIQQTAYNREAKSENDKEYDAYVQWQDAQNSSYKKCHGVAKVFEDIGIGLGVAAVFAVVGILTAGAGDVALAAGAAEVAADVAVEGAVDAGATAAAEGGAEAGVEGGVEAGAESGGSGVDVDPDMDVDPDVGVEGDEGFTDDAGDDFEDNINQNTDKVLNELDENQNIIENLDDAGDEPDPTRAPEEMNEGNDESDFPEQRESIDQSNEGMEDEGVDEDNDSRMKRMKDDFMRNTNEKFQNSQLARRLGNNMLTRSLYGGFQISFGHIGLRLIFDRVGLIFAGLVDMRIIGNLLVDRVADLGGTAGQCIDTAAATE
ncbi:MAG: hypothetical protein AAGL49_12245, partial [Pseudomonadota bacterium]